jgi:hypothetical protein
MFFYLALLAFILSPGILLSLPPGAGPAVTALTHAIVISLVYTLTSKMIYKTIA